MDSTHKTFSILPLPLAGEGRGRNSTSITRILKKIYLLPLLLIGALGFNTQAQAAVTVKLTSPTANAMVAAPGSFVLTATATSSTSTIKSVAFYQGTTLLKTVTASPYTYTWSNVAAGTYSLTAKATDNKNATATSTAVSVKSVTDNGPTVSLTSPANNTALAAPASFTLSATATSTVTTISKVDFYNGATLLGTATASPYTNTWTGVAAGTYSLTAKATDALGKATTSTAVTVVSDAPPSVSITSPANNAVAMAPASFTLTANASSTTSTISKVEFYNGTTLLQTVAAAPYTWTWSNAAAGTYSITAKATDAAGLTSTSNPVSVISDQGPVVSLTSPANGSQITSPNSLALTANASSSLSSIAKVEFYAYNGSSNTLIGTATAAPYGVTWNSVPVGNYTLTAKATDAYNIATTSSGITVTAVADQPPAVSIATPANGSTAKVPGSFTLTATASSTTSTVAKVDYYANNGTTNTLIGTASTAPYSYIWSNVALGTYSLTAVATDALNSTTTSNPVSVTVNSGEMQAYYIHADHLGTPRVITDTAGNVVWTWDNVDPFGNNPPNENPSGLGLFTCNLRHAGQYFDIETSLFQNYFRDYNPAIGEYIQSDLIGLNGGINTYTYVGGNPIGNIDPTGLFEVHGNWCGPDWTGGHKHPYHPAPQGYYLPPTDYTDAACERHDKCYETCREVNKCDKSARKSCMVACNQLLASAQRFNSSSGTSLATSLAIWLGMQPPPDPGEDDPSCKCEKK